MNHKPIMLELKDKLLFETRLGRLLAPEEKGCIADLNETPQAFIDALRNVESSLAVRCLEYLYTPDRHDSARTNILKEFQFEVVFLKKDKQSWLRGGIFFPSTSDKAWQFQHRGAEILKELDKKPEESWVTLPLPEHEIDTLEPCYGRPCLERPNETYRWHERRMRDEIRVCWCQWASKKLEPIADIEIMMRRWFALEAACIIRHSAVTGTPAELVRLEYPEIQTYSADALIGLRALHAERLFMPDEKRKLPGFRGPDAWYAGELPAGV